MKTLPKLTRLSQMPSGLSNIAIGDTIAKYGAKSKPTVKDKKIEDFELNSYFFELWMENYYSIVHKPNGDYDSKQVACIMTGYNRFIGNRINTLSKKYIRTNENFAKWTLENCREFFEKKYIVEEGLLADDNDSFFVEQNSDNNDYICEWSSCSYRGFIAKVVFLSIIKTYSKSLDSALIKMWIKMIKDDLL